MFFVSIAAMVLSAQAAPIAIIMREGDATSLAAPAAVTQLADPEHGVWQANGEEVERASLQLHLTPYFSDSAHDFKRLRDSAADIFRVADASRTPGDFRNALTAASVIPPVNPEARSLMLLRVEREFAVVQLQQGAVVPADRLLQDIAFRTDFGQEDFEKPYKQHYELVVGKLRSERAVELKVSATPGAALELSLDGGAFAKQLPPRVTPGVHELIARMNGKLGLAHSLEIPSGKPQLMVLQTDVERGLIFSPDGFFVRAGEAFTPAMAALILRGTNATQVWLVETLRANPPNIRVSVCDGSVTHSAVVPLKNASLLRPSTVAQQKDLADAIVAAARTADTAGLQPLAHYDVVHGQAGDLSLVAAEHEPVYKKWWLWTAVGAVVVAGVVTTVVLVTRDSGVTLLPTVTSN